jgi:UDPglucose 6-dehydrogenase
VLSNPEFLAEGTAINDLHHPDRVLIGGEQTPEGLAAIEQLVKIYETWVPRERIITTNTWSSELSKLVSISIVIFMHDFRLQMHSSLSEFQVLMPSRQYVKQPVPMYAKWHMQSVKIRVLDQNFYRHLSVRFAHFYKQQLFEGFGGSCFQKDVLNLVYLCECLNLKQVADYWMGVRCE